MVVFKITNKLDGKIYIGTYTKNDNNNNNYFGLSAHIRHLIKKYGTLNFEREILEECDNIDELRVKEAYWIKKFDSTNPEIGYNIFDLHQNKYYKQNKLTSVEVNTEMFDKFKIKSIEKNITFKEVVHAAINAVLNNKFVSGSFI